QRHSELALPMLQRLLEENRLGMESLQAVAFGAGPGSFTGLRIACGIAQGLAFARSLPVAGVSSFEAIAEESGADRVIACIDARMREVYYAALEKRAGAWTEVVPGRCVPPAEAPSPPGDGWIACGSGLAAYPDFLQNRPMRKLHRVHPEVHPT